MILKTGPCFTSELELNCPTIVGCVTALPVGPAAVAGTTQVLGKDGQYHALPAAPVAAAPALSVSGNQLTIAGGNTVTLPDSDTQDLSISGNVISLTNGGSVTLPAGTVADGSETKVTAGANVTVTGAGTTASPYVVAAAAAAATVFATPAETVAGTATALAVNPADLYARENIAAQTGLGLVLSAIPAPTASQSPWGVNTLGETLHYEPGVGWKLVANAYYKPYQEIILPSIPSGPTVTASEIVPRAGRLLLNLEVFNFGASSGASIIALARIAGNPPTTRHGSRAVGGMLPVEGISSLTAYFTVAAGDILEFLAYPTTAASGPIYTKYSYQYVD